MTDTEYKQVVLQALYESGHWAEADFIAWADKLIEASETPAAWMVSLSLSKNWEEVSEAIRAMADDVSRDHGAKVNQVAAGIVLLDLKAQRLSEEQARNRLGDIADPDGVHGIQVEEMYQIDLADPRLEKLATAAKLAVEKIGPPDLPRLG